MILALLLACAQTPTPAASPAAPAAAPAATPVAIADPVGVPQVLAAPVAGTAFPAPATPLHTPPLAEGDGKDKVAAYCSVCHATTYITMQPPLPPEKWKAEVEKMVNAYGAQVPEAERAPIIAYLSAHYGPDRR